MNLVYKLSCSICWVILAAITPAHVMADPGDRLLAAYTNDDGTKPDGTEAKQDDTSALRKALADGPGVVRIGRGFYRWGDVQIPENVTVIGAGKATVVRSNGANTIFRQSGVADWSLRDIVLDGEEAGDWKTRKDSGRSGVFTEGCRAFEISGVTARNFAGAGFQLTRNKGRDGGRLSTLDATGCYVGVRFDIRAEYITATQLNCHHNVVGCIIHAGNTSITASNFGDNIDGLHVEDKDNGSHGAVSNCLLNHNERYALLARKVQNGMAISNCCFFYGQIRLEDSAGVNITSSLVSCTVQTQGAFVNRFAGNNIIPLKWTFAFGPKDIVEDNFTKAGPWSPSGGP